MKRLLIILIMCMSLACAAQNTPVRWHNEQADTTRITEMLKEGAEMRFANPSQCVGWYARKFIGTPYVAHTLEGDEELLTVNLDELDCTTFVDIALALAYTTGEGRQGWHDFLYNLRRMRYRGGEVDGYSSRLHYNCDWVIDNSYRGNLMDMTRNVGNSRELIRTIDFMTSNREKYPALADSAQYARILNIENGYRNHKFPYIKTSELNSKEVQKNLKDGDVVAFVSNLKNLDVTHLGVIVKGDDGGWHVLHASSVDGKVEISEMPLAQFVKRNPRWIGIRVYRLRE